MTNLDPLILDFLEWLASEPRSYAEVMEAWRTSCPRLTVWEDTIDRGFVVRNPRPGQSAVIDLTNEGRAFLCEYRQSGITLLRSRMICRENHDTLT